MALPTLRRRFWAKVEKTSTCWLWVGAKQKGYGAFWTGRQIVRAHRWILGVTDPEIVVAHRCDVRACVRRSHLFKGSQKDNMQDCVRKGRLHPHGMRGEQIASHKLTEKQVRLIHRLYSTGKHTQVSLGARFGVTHRAIGYVLSGSSWKHLTPSRSAPVQVRR